MSQTTPSLSPQEVADFDLLPRRIMRAFLRWRSAMEANYSAEGLSDLIAPGAGMVLYALYEDDGRTISELAQRARVTHVAIVHLVQKLEKAALVERRPSPSDRRFSQVWLTKAGWELQPRMNLLHERNLATLETAIGGKDAANLSALLHQLIEGLDPSPETDPVAGLTGTPQNS